jgi:hypothetical protein
VSPLRRGTAVEGAGACGGAGGGGGGRAGARGLGAGAPGQGAGARARWPPGRRWSVRAVACGGGERARSPVEIAAVENTERPTRVLEETMRDFYSGARRQDLWRRAPVHVGAASAGGRQRDR